jgi:uncharacterized alkaline shock family protein YloU
MGIFKRIILSLFSIIAAFISAAFIIITIFKNSYDYLVKYYSDYILYNKYGVVISVLAGLGIFAVSLYCFYIAVYSNRDKKAVGKKTGIGEIRISLSAVETIALSSIRRLEGIKDMRAIVSNSGDGISVDMKVVLYPDTIIPMLSEDIQDRVKKAIEDTTGIKVYEVRVLIDNIHSSPAYKAKTGE